MSKRPVAAMSLDAAKDLVARCYCSECGELRFKTPSGAVCPNHKLVGGVTDQELSDAPLAKKMLEECHIDLNKPL